MARVAPERQQQPDRRGLLEGARRGERRAGWGAHAVVFVGSSRHQHLHDSKIAPQCCVVQGGEAATVHCVQGALGVHEQPDASELRLRPARASSARPLGVRAARRRRGCGRARVHAAPDRPHEGIRPVRQVPQGDAQVEAAHDAFVHAHEIALGDQPAHLPRGGCERDDERRAGDGLLVRQAGVVQHHGQLVRADRALQRERPARATTTESATCPRGMRRARAEYSHTHAVMARSSERGDGHSRKCAWARAAASSSASPAGSKAAPSR